MSKETMQRNFFNMSAEHTEISNAYPLCASPIPILTITAVYLLVVVRMGPRWMRTREPYNVRLAMLVYNAIQIVFNAYLCYNTFRYVFVERVYNLRCMESLEPSHPFKMHECKVMYLYYINKILDLVDTVFFVLRKNFRQITLLHVFHHVMMINFTYMLIRLYGFGGHPYFGGTMNCAVHTMMYAYYFISALQPEQKKNLWWKKYLTQMQFIQFFIIGTHSAVSLLTPNCRYPRSLLIIVLLQAVLMVCMFTNFYIKAYTSSTKKLSKPETTPGVSVPVKSRIGDARKLK